MAQTYKNTFKNCSTCKTWQGDRDINASENTISIGSPSSKGKCEVQKGEDKLAFMNCDKWAPV